MSTPLSPYDLMERAGALRIKWRKKLVEQVNKALDDQIQDLESGAEALIDEDCFDAEGWHYWQIYHNEVVAQFRAAKWVVEEDGEYSYNFLLPGTLIHNVSTGDKAESDQG